MAGCNCLRAVGQLNPGAFKPFRKSNPMRDNRTSEPVQKSKGLVTPARVKVPLRQLVWGRLPGVLPDRWHGAPHTTHV